MTGKNAFESFINGIETLDTLASPGTPMQKIGPGVNQEKQVQMPSQSVQPRKANGIMLAYILHPRKAYLLLYLDVDAPSVTIPAKYNTSYHSINKTDLEGFISECKTELHHRGFRYVLGERNGINGNPIAKVFTFNEIPSKFSKEMNGLISYFKDKYRF